jgi:hypothetical protein
MVGDDLSNLRGQFPGPPNSPYEGGTFEGLSSSSTYISRVNLSVVVILIIDRFEISITSFNPSSDR